MKARTVAMAVGALGLVASCASQVPTAPGPATPAPGDSAKTAAVAPFAVDLPNAGFEAPPRPGDRCTTGWECTAHNDPNSFRFFLEEGGAAGGARSFCIEPAGREPWGSFAQAIGLGRDVARLRGMRVRFSSAVRVKGVTGLGAGPYLVAQGGSGQVLGTSRRLVKGDRDWQRVEVEMDVPRGTFLLEVGMILLGKGTACFDDARLEALGPSSGPV